MAEEGGVRKWVVGCVALLAVGVAGAGACLYVVLRERPKLDARLELPHTVHTGETISVVVVLKNPHSGGVRLDSVDVADSFLNGLQFVDVDPPAKDTMHVPILDQRTWSFENTVGPGAEMRVTFRLRAIGPGRYTGSIDACNEWQDCTNLYADVVVTDPPPPEPASTQATPVPGV